MDNCSNCLSRAPVISVVMPVYNVEAYLHEAVESIVQQTFSEWELILVDDGSTDESGAMCDAWAAQDARIQVIHTPNGGLSHARNTGMAVAVGEWIIFPDSDDRLAKHALETMLQHTDHVDIVICMLEEFPKKVVYQAVNQPVRYATFADTAPDFPHLHGMHVFSSACTKLYRREHIHIHFDESVRHMEDLLFNLQYLPTCQGLCIIPDVLYQYRRDHSLTLSKRFWLDTLKIRKIELQSFLHLFPDNKAVRLMVLRRYLFYVLRWLFEVVDLKNINPAQKKMLLSLHLPDAIDEPALQEIHPRGFEGMLWRLIQSGDINLLYTFSRFYTHTLLKQRKITI